MPPRPRQECLCHHADPEKMCRAEARRYTNRSPRITLRNMEFERKNIRLSQDNYLGQRWYFVTICCDRKRSLFANEARAQWAIGHLRKAAEANLFGIYAYCVMPNHVHLLVQGWDAQSDLLRFVERFKQQTAHEFQEKHGYRLWQKKFYDRILRHDDNADGVAWYIWMNPVRKGLCRSPQEYAFSGSFMTEWKAIVQPSKEWQPPWKEKLV